MQYRVRRLRYRIDYYAELIGYILYLPFDTN